MIKLENTEVVGWEHAIRGMRNPMNSWEKSDSYVHVDSYFPSCEYVLGPNDHDLAMRLAKDGSVHAKYRRMIAVYVDITAPLYWWAEMDTYKVGTVRNSCSFMHKGVSKPFDIHDFSIRNEAIYEVLTPPAQKEYTLTYPYETEEFKRYKDLNGRSYRVYRNGKVIREAFEYTDTKGRHRIFEEREATQWRDTNGYFHVKMSGRCNGAMLVHRLVLEMWNPKPEGVWQANHIDGNKGNNSLENLEWTTPSDNVTKAVEARLYDNLGSLHKRYLTWKANHSVIPTSERLSYAIDVEKGLTHKELATKYHITPEQANNLRYDIRHSENEELFQEAYIWDKVISELNDLRDQYLETKDDHIFQCIRTLSPQGYLQRSTVMLNYEVLSNIYHSRRNHRLDEWRELCKWIEGLPYSELITGEEVN